MAALSIRAKLLIPVIFALVAAFIIFRCVIPPITALAESGLMVIPSQVVRLRADAWQRLQFLSCCRKTPAPRLHLCREGTKRRGAPAPEADWLQKRSKLSLGCHRELVPSREAFQKPREERRNCFGSSSLEE